APTSNVEKGAFISFMATADNTTVNVSEIKTGVVFIGTPTTGGTSNPITVTLDKGQSYILSTSQQTDDVNGTRITATKPIAVCSVGWLQGDQPGAAGRDIGYDELVPTENLPPLGEWVLFEGNAAASAAAALELPCIVAVEDGT